MRSFVGFLMVFVAILSTYPVKADEPDAKRQAELINTLHAFTNEHSITPDALEGMLGRLVLNETNLSKGGVGIIDTNTFILLKEERNALAISGHKWEGKQASENELVLTDGRRVLDSLQGADLAKLTIVLFSPSEVRFINLSTARAGKYER